MDKIDCVILAAGKSTRMNMELNKQFLEINNKPVIYYSLYKFLNSDYINNVILVLSKDYITYCIENVIDKFFYTDKIKIVVGGCRRQDSVLNALSHVESDYVMVHDGARPFVSEECIKNGIKNAYRYGASSCYVLPKDTIKINEGNSINTLNRDNLLCVQTPQCFKISTLLAAYDYVVKNDKTITDDTSALELIGEETYFYLGDYFNIKITTKEDLYFGNMILSNILGEN